MNNLKISIKYQRLSKSITKQDLTVWCMQKLLKKRFYLFERERERVHAHTVEEGAEEGGEADSLLSRDPNVGLDPRIPGNMS